MVVRELLRQLGACSSCRVTEWLPVQRRTVNKLFASIVNTHKELLFPTRSPCVWSKCLVFTACMCLLMWSHLTQCRVCEWESEQESERDLFSPKTRTRGVRVSKKERKEKYTAANAAHAAHAAHAASLLSFLPCEYVWDVQIYLFSSAFARREQIARNAKCIDDRETLPFSLLKVRWREAKN